VTKESYDMITTDRWFQEQMECDDPMQMTSDVCYCPAGFSDYRCSTKEFTRCYVNITSPALYEGCSENYEDSDYYVYSI
jgi:hypothetical protein